MGRNHSHVGGSRNTSGRMNWCKCHNRSPDCLCIPSSYQDVGADRRNGNYPGHADPGGGHGRLPDDDRSVQKEPHSRNEERAGSYRNRDDPGEHYGRPRERSESRHNVVDEERNDNYGHHRQGRLIGRIGPKTPDVRLPELGGTTN